MNPRGLGKVSLVRDIPCGREAIKKTEDTPGQNSVYLHLIEMGLPVNTRIVR
jgi:hypothetical protein